MTDNSTKARLELVRAELVALARNTPNPEVRNQLFQAQGHIQEAHRLVSGSLRNPEPSGFGVDHTTVRELDERIAQQKTISSGTMFEPVHHAPLGYRQVKLTDQRIKDAVFKEYSSTQPKIQSIDDFSLPKTDGVDQGDKQT